MFENIHILLIGWHPQVLRIHDPLDPDWLRLGVGDGWCHSRPTPPWEGSGWWLQGVWGQRKGTWSYRKISQKHFVRQRQEQWPWKSKPITFPGHCIPLEDNTSEGFQYIQKGIAANNHNIDTAKHQQTRKKHPKHNCHPNRGGEAAGLRSQSTHLLQSVGPCYRERRITGWEAKKLNETQYVYIAISCWKLHMYGWHELTGKETHLLWEFMRMKR